MTSADMYTGIASTEDNHLNCCQRCMSFSLPWTGQCSPQAKSLCLWSKLLFDSLYNLQNTFVINYREQKGVIENLFLTATHENREDH
jgi:hypothetical protein